MAAISDADVSIDASGNIRWTGAATTNRHSVLEFIQWLMDKQDDEQAAGDDLLDITVDTPFDRSTDQIVTLNTPFNIDDTFATHLYDGSVTQNDGDDIYSGLEVLGPVETGTEYMILQAGKVLPAFWGTGINAPGGASLVFSRHLVKSREGGANIDGRRITVLARELGDQYRRFPVTLGTGNSVAAIGNGSDIFNTSSDATIAGWDSIVNTEGFQELNIDGTGAAGQEFYSQWDKGTQTVNDTYERTKWITQRAHVADSNAETGNDFVIDNATITGAACEFSATADSELLACVEVRIKIGSEVGGLTGTVYAELYDSDDAAPAAPTGALLARSEPVLVSAFTTSYETTIFRFNRWNPNTGADQIDGLTLTANQEYFIAIRHDEGDADDYLHVEGDTTSGDDGNRAHDTAGWTGVTGEQLNFSVRTSPAIHGVHGELFQGISVEVGFSGEAGAGVLETEGTNDELAIWGTLITYDTLVSGPFHPGEFVKFERSGAVVSGGMVLYDDGVDELVVALENPAASVIQDNDTITGLQSGATAAIAVTITDEDLSGGMGYVLAKDDNGATGELYLQVVAGLAPVNTNRIRSTAGNPLADYADATASITSRTLIPEFLGTSTGSNIIGAYGIGFQPADVGASDRFTSLDNSSRVPPNNVLFTVSGLVSGEDRVLVGPRNGTALDRGQWLVSTALTTNAETALVVKTGTDTVPFPNNEENWPASGIGANVSRLRVERDDGVYKRVPYDSHDGNNTFTLGTPDTGTTTLGNPDNKSFTRASGSFLDDGFENGCRFTSTGFATSNGTFTVESISANGLTLNVVGTPLGSDGAGSGDERLNSTGWDFSTGTAGMDNAAVDNDVFLAFIDVLATAASASFTGVHAGVDRDLFVRVRDGGTAGDGIPIKTFEATSAQFLSTPQTVAATRTDDA